MAVLVISPLLESIQPNSIQHNGSIKGNLIAQMSHVHSLFQVDNGTAFEFINNAVQGTAIAALIVPFGCTRDGCTVFMAIKAQLVTGKDVWGNNEAESILQTHKASGMK